MTDWAPATDAEAAMREALLASDQEQYFRVLAGVDLLLPVSPEAAAGREAAGWGTWSAGGRTHVLAFSSREAMVACLAEHAGAARSVPFRELAAAWPNLEWWLAVNPGLPIEGYLPAWFVAQLARGDTRLPGRAQTRSEPEEMRAAAQTVPRARSERLETLGRAAVPPARATGVSGPPPAPAARAEAIPSQSGGPTLGQEWAAAVRPTAAPEVPPSHTTQPAAPEAEEAPAEPASAWPDFEPANDLESQLLTAATAGRTDHLLSSLLLAKVLLPIAEGADPQARPGAADFTWRTDKLDDEPYVVVATSPDRIAEYLDSEVPTLAIRFVQLIRAWPDESWSLVVNPGTPIELRLSSAQIAGLASSAAEVGLDDDAGEASETGAGAAGRARQASVTQPVPMQKAIAPSQLPWYLERSYDRVSGFVHREQEVAHLRTPAKLVAGLGLRYENSPFDPAADEIYVLRWPAYRPSLYRIPYGGGTEAAMAAMEGWVIERPPFRGNGFAPSDSEDVIAEFKVDSIRLPHGAQLWRLRADGSSQLVAKLDADGPTWQQAEES